MTRSIESLGRSVSVSCSEASTSLPSRLGWLLEAAEDCDRLIEMLNDAIQDEAALVRAEKKEAEQQKQGRENKSC